MATVYDTVCAAIKTALDAVYAPLTHTHTGYASSSHNHNLSDLNNMEAVQVTVTFTDNTTATYKLVRYTGS